MTNESDPHTDILAACMIINDEMKKIIESYNLISQALETLPLTIKWTVRDKLNTFAEAGPEFYSELIIQKDKYLQNVLSTENRQSNGITHDAAA